MPIFTPLFTDSGVVNLGGTLALEGEGMLAGPLLNHAPFEEGGADRYIPPADLSGGGSVPREGYRRNRDLDAYRISFRGHLCGDLFERIEERHQKTGRPVRILDAGCGEGIAAAQLKAKFGRKVIVETNDLQDLDPARSDKHYVGDFLQISFPNRYDIILSLFGPADALSREENCWAIFQKTAEILALGGEALIGLRIPDMDSPQGQLQIFRHLEDCLRLVNLGLLLKYYLGVMGHAIYIRRLSRQKVPDIRGLCQQIRNENRAFHNRFEMGPDGQFTEKGRADYLKWAAQRVRQREARFQAMVSILTQHSFKVGSLYLPNFGGGTVAEILDQLELEDPIQFVQATFEWFVDEFKRRRGREPTQKEINAWTRGDADEDEEWWQRFFPLESMEGASDLALLFLLKERDMFEYAAKFSEGLVARLRRWFKI